MMEDAIKQFIAAHDKNFIFGIGNYSAALAERLAAIGLDFDGFLSTSKTESDRFTQLPLERFMDHPVFTVDDHEFIMTGRGGRRAVYSRSPKNINRPLKGC